MSSPSPAVASDPIGTSQTETSSPETSPTEISLPVTSLSESSLSDAAAEAALQDHQVADWLAAHPDFFDAHADLISEVRIRHPHGGRAISLVERQVVVLREKNKALEQRMAELIRIGQENDAMGARLQRLTRDLLRAADPAGLPALLADGLRDGLAVPQVAIRLWGLDAALAEPFGADVSADLRRRTDELSQPYCGPNAQSEASGWLPGGGPETASLALIALRVGANPASFGLLVMGSPDPARFQAGMGTAFLERLGEVASAALSRLLSHPDAPAAASGALARPPSTTRTV